MNPLFLLIEIFYERLQNGDFNNRPYSLAAELEALAEQAWDEVDEIANKLQPALRIDN